MHETNLKPSSSGEDDSSSSLAAIAANDIAAAAILNDQWKWRHHHCWRLLTRFGLTAMTVALIPFIRRLDAIEKQLGDIQIGNWELFFPVAGWFIAQAAVYLFAEEYVRCRPLEAMCFRVLARQHYTPQPAPLANSGASSKGPMRLPPIGQTTIFIYSAFATLLTFLGIALLRRMGFVKIDFYLFWGVGSVLSAVSMRLAYLMARHAVTRINEVIDLQKQTEIGLNNVEGRKVTLPTGIVENVTALANSSPNNSLITPGVPPRRQDTEVDSQ
jgi:hypothetical protein